MVIDSTFPKCCASCVYGDNSTTFCRKKDRYNSRREFDNSKYCKLYKSIYELINKKGCPRCHRHGNIILDDIEDYDDQACIECNDCGWAMYGNNRHDVIHDWLNRD